MRSISNGVFNSKKYLSNQAARVLAVSLIVALFSQLFVPMQSSVVHAETAINEGESANGYLDKVVFGDSASESAHQFTGDFTSTITGFLGQPARVSNPRTPLEGQGGDLTFTMKVDPYLQNYFTMKFSDEAGHQPVLVVNGEQVGFYRNGDYTFNRSWGIPNRFLYYTIMLPLETTVGKETVEITIKTMNVFGNMDTTSKKYYTAYTHPQAYLNVEDEPQGAELFPADMASIVKADITDEEKKAKVDAHRQAQINRFNTLSGQIDSSAGAKFSIERYKDDMRYYSRILNQSWSPANTPELKKAALARIFKSIDNHVKDYYADSRRVLRGGHQGDWGSYYSALGEALYIVENLIKDDAVYGQAAFDAFLNQTFVTGTAAGEFSLAGVDWNGGELTRREAWERALKASFDFARSRLSYIYNQQLYTYEGAWEAHEGLGIIGSSFFEGKQRSHDILLEALGVIPFLGEEVLVGPGGEELDLYHSLFHHDQAAVFTNDYVHIVGKGLAKSKLDAEGKVVRRKPYGEHYLGITEAGLSRENTYVGNYGEAVNYLPEYFYKTLNHAGDEALNDEILKLALKTINARKYLRVPMLNGDKNRVMTADQTLDERNEGPIGFDAYGPRASSGTALLFASLEMAMVQNEQRYSGPEWDPYWQYAKEAVGITQQQMLDNQLFNYGFGQYSSMSAENFLVPEVYSYLSGERASYERTGGTLKAGVILPHTDFDYYTPEEIVELGVDPADYQQFAWADIDNMILSVRDGDLSFNGSLYLRNRGLAGNGRLHVMKDNYESVVQVATNSKFQYEDYYIRTQNVDVDFMSDQAVNVGNLPQALAGEVNPSAYQPGVGRVNRDNFEVDHPYSGYPDLMTARYGKYFMAINTTRSEYGNEQSFEIELPSDYNGSTVLDLVTGASVPVVDGKVTISHKSAMVLKLSSDFDAAQKPNHVDFVNALAGNGYVGVSWRTAAGGKTYTIKRSTTENGTYETIATGVTGNYYKDTDVQNGSVYYYKVAAVNDNGAGWDSWRAKADLTASVSGMDGVWRDDRIGTTSGNATVNGASVAIASAGGTGLGTGDDYNIYKRNINDSLHFVSQVVGGDSTVSAKIDSHSGAASGIMLRDQLASNTRYMYFGADQDGNLVLQSRTRDSRVQWSGIVMSPYNPGSTGYKAADYPYIKLVREHDSQNVNAFVSKDGVSWKFVKKMITLLPYAYHAGVVAADQAQFSEVSVTETLRTLIEPYIVQVKDKVTVNWNKPKQAASFNLYRTNDKAAGLTDPVFKPGTTELVDGSPWTKVLAGTRATSFEEASLKYGSLHYKVMAVHGDGSLQPFSATVSAYADSIAVVMEDAESLPAKDYTKASFYLYHKELDRVKAEMAKPDFDEEQLINDIYAAKSLLVSFRTLLTKVQMEPSMVRASEKYWGNDNISETQNGWFLFDGITTNLTHTRSAVSWVDIDFGEGNEKVVDTFKYLPRESHFTRANNTVFKGSNDGVNWVDLHKITSVTSFKWYSAINPDPTPYRYIRIYDNHSGFVNFQEVEFLERGIDKTLLTQLLDESAAAVAAKIYTAESLQPLEQAVTAATPVDGNESATQEEIDAASASLLSAFEGLAYIAGMPVLDSIGNKTVIAEKELSFVVQATNTDEDIVYGVSGLPEGATFNADTQTFAWTPAKEQSGIYAVTFTVTSGEKSSSQTIKITVKGQPIFSSDTTVELTAKQQITYKVTATDLSGEALSYSAGNLPAGAVFNASTGAFIWTPGQADYGSHPVTFTVSNSNFSVTQIVDFKVMLHILSSTDITKGSYYLYMKEVERIEAEMVKPEADKVQLAAELGQAEGLLVPVPSLYSFEGNADNSFGTSHGTVDGTPVYTEGKVGQALNMSGDDYATLPSSHIMSTYNEITFATWVYWRGGSNWQRIFDFGNNTNQYMFLTPSSGNNTLRFAIKNGGGEQMVQTSQLATNQWVHVAVTLGNGTAQLYVNGEQKATVNGFTIKPSDFKPSKNYIGKSQWPDPLFNGLVDEFRIYNHVLSAEEIQAVVNNTVKWIDNSLLPILLEEASAVNADYYSEESVAVLQKAVSDAELVTANADATQAEIDAADTSLLAALKGLQWKDVSPSLDPAVPNGKNGWYTSPVNVTLSPSPIAEYSLDGGSSWVAYDAPINLKEEGTHKLLYRSVKTGEEKSLEIKIDLTAPVAKITGAASYTIDQTVTMACTATDVTSSVYGTPCDKPLLQVKAYTLVAGQNTVTFTAEDMAGHKTTVTYTFTVKATFDSLKIVTAAFLQATGAQGSDAVKTALKTKLDQAKAAAGRGDTASVKSLMTSYIGQVTDQSGKTLTKEQADILIRWAQSLI